MKTTTCVITLCVEQFKRARRQPLAAPGTMLRTCGLSRRNNAGYNLMAPLLVEEGHQVVRKAQAAQGPVARRRFRRNQAIRTMPLPSMISGMAHKHSRFDEAKSSRLIAVLMLSAMHQEKVHSPHSWLTSDRRSLCSVTVLEFCPGDRWATASQRPSGSDGATPGLQGDRDSPADPGHAGLPVWLHGLRRG